jgi:hypothetical protein
MFLFFERAKRTMDSTVRKYGAYLQPLEQVQLMNAFGPVRLHDAVPDLAPHAAQRPGMPSTWSKWPCVNKSRSSLRKPTSLRSNWRCVCYCHPGKAGGPPMVGWRKSNAIRSSPFGAVDEAADL